MPSIVYLRAHISRKLPDGRRYGVSRAAEQHDEARDNPGKRYISAPLPNSTDCEKVSQRDEQTGYRHKGHEMGWRGGKVLREMLANACDARVMLGDYNRVDAFSLPGELHRDQKA